LLTARSYERGSGWTPVTDVAVVSDVIDEPGRLLVAHADLATLTPQDVTSIADEFDLHPLAIEDATKARQRPKVEQYAAHVFLVLHQLDRTEEQLNPRQISCFVGPRWMLVLHDGADRCVEQALRRLESGVPEPERGFADMLHALLDAVVDDHQAHADELEREVEDIEEIVLADPRAPVQRPLYSIKQRVARFRRYVLPVSRILDRVIEGATGPIEAERRSYFRDVQDHTLRIGDQIRSTDDLARAILDLIGSVHAQEMGEATKRLSAWAAIIAVPTYIASVYGMNFELVPDEGRIFGFWFAITMMAVTGSGLFAYFKRKRWI